MALNPLTPSFLAHAPAPKHDLVASLSTRMNQTSRVQTPWLWSSATLAAVAAILITTQTRSGKNKTLRLVNLKTLYETHSAYPVRMRMGLRSLHLPYSFPFLI